MWFRLKSPDDGTVPLGEHGRRSCQGPSLRCPWAEMELVFRALASVVGLVSRETCFPLSDKIPSLKITINGFLQKSTHLLSLRPGFGTAKDKTDCWLYQKFGGQILPLLLLTLNKTSDCISSILRTQKKIQKNKPLIFGALWVGFKELFCFCFKTFGKKTLDFEILFPYVPTWESWPPASIQSTLSTSIFN